MANYINLDYSIVVCSFNPDERIFKRCLEAIYSIDFHDITYEIIIVDNNSLPALHTLPYVQDFLNNTPNSRYVIETSQGLTHARIRGTEESKGEYIIFFDDDNEPHSDYLINLKKLNTDHPSVAAWGPGNVWVDFIDGIDKSINKSIEPYIKARLFQERHEEFINYGNSRSWQAYYPYGTGLCVKYNYLKDYSAKVKKNEFSAVDRKGNSLSSGGDLQVVWFCITESAAVGVAPTLKVNHLIPKKRANFTYLKQLMFAVSISFHICTNEMLKEHKTQITNSCPSANNFVLHTVWKYIKVLIANNQMRTLKSLNYVGIVYGTYIAINKPIPKTVTKTLNLYGINTKNLPL